MTLQICRWTLAFIWIHQGIVPKWLGPHMDELAMNLAIGATPQQALWISYIGGTLEVLLGLLIFFQYRRRLFYLVSVIAIAVLHLVVSAAAPIFLMSAFNAMTINVAIAALSLIALNELSKTGIKTDCP